MLYLTPSYGPFRVCQRFSFVPNVNTPITRQLTKKDFQMARNMNIGMWHTLQPTTTQKNGFYPPLTVTVECSRQLVKILGLEGESSKIVKHIEQPEQPVKTKNPNYNSPITEDEFILFLDALSRGACHKTACRYSGRSETGMRFYYAKTEGCSERVGRARADWELFHLDRLSVKDDNGSGASARGRNSLGALASVDKRFRKDVHVGATINNTMILADPRPPATIGNPSRYAMGQADARVIDTPTPALEITPAPTPPPAHPHKPEPIL